MLVFPPQWTPAMPHLALPALSSYLRSHGVAVIQRDLNIETYNAILTRAYIEQSLARLRLDYGADGKRKPNRPVLPPRERVQYALREGPRLGRQIENALRVVRSEDFFDGPAGLDAVATVIDSLEVASLPFFPAALELTTLLPPAPVDSSRHLLQVVREPQYNMFLPIFRRGILADIVREQPDIVGISIPTMEQMLAGMTLAYLIKQSGVRCHVTVGGPHISMLREQLPRARAVFDLIDSAVIFEGETPLLRLAEALAGDKDLSRVPNLIYRDGPAIRANPIEQAEPLDLPTPDFDGLPLGNYLSPRRVLPLQTARGCYHGKCAFCNVGYGRPTAHYRQLPAARVVEQMNVLREKWGVQHIFFADEAITPRNLRDMSAALAAADSPMTWCGCVRFEKALTGDLLQSMARGGCRMLLFGLETASRPIVERMVKGVQVEQMGRILEDGTQAGIWNHTFFFFGFPGEEISNAQDTVNFLYEHKLAVHSASPGTFLLERYSPAHLHPAEYGITRIIQDPDKDLAIYFDYEVAAGMDNALAEQVVERFTEVLPRKPFAQFYVNDVYRFLYTSRLRQQRQPLPPWLV
jgi:hypothetical protein